MAFKGLRFARGEVRNNSAGGVMKLVMAAIGVIPLLYGALYLLAFLDPYEKLDTVPVAVVNEDEGAVVNGSYRTVGDEVVDRLKGNHDGLGWQFVDADQARQGLEDGRYYMTCTIPADFTRDIASADTDTPEHAQLLIDYNETQNMLASQIGGTVWKEVRTQVSDAVAEEYWSTVFDQVNSGADQIQEAADGAGELYDGLKDARSGSRTIADNLVTLNTGAAALNDGLKQLVSGTLQLEDGTGTLLDGAHTLKNGTASLASGASSVASGAASLDSGASTLAKGASSLKTGASTLKNGTASLASGASDLASGTSSLSSGAKNLKSGTASLASGASDLASGASTLSDGASQLRSQGTSALASGASLLEEQTRALPDAQTAQQAAAGSEQLAAGIQKLQQAAGQLAQGAQGLQGAPSQMQDGIEGVLEGTSKVEQALGQVDSQLGTAKEDAIAAKKDIGAAAAALQGMDMSTLSADQRQAVASALGSLQSASEDIGDENGGALLEAGTAQAYVQGAKAGLVGTGDPSNPGVDEGLAQLKQGAQALASGVDQLAAGIGASDDTSSDTLNGGLASLAAGYGSFSSQVLPLVQGAPALRSAIEQVNGGAQQVDSSMAQLAGGAAQVNTGASSLSDGAAQVDSGAGQLADGAAQASAGASRLSDGAAQVDSGAGQLVGGTRQVEDGAQRLASGAAQLSGGASKVASGAVQVDEGVASAVSGAQRLASGAAQLRSGAQDAQDGSAQVADGSKKLADGSGELAAGLGDAVDGSGELADGLADGADGMRVGNTKTRAQVMNDPVQLDESYYTSVKNYGTGFSPYFIALGLWVGALMTSFVFRPLNKRLILSGGNPAMVAFANYMPFALMSVVQALLMLVVLQFGLQLQIDNVGLYYAFGILTGLVFAAIMQMLTAAFGFPGKFVAIILLMLQLTSSAGTFPIEQTPRFFQLANPFMPMTYVVRGMRQVMTGLDMGTAAHCAGVLAAIGLGCFLVTALVARAKRLVTMEDLHPILQLGES